MAEMLVWMEHQREVRRASKSCWMRSSTEALMDRVGTVMLSTCVMLRGRGRDRTRADAM